VACQVTKSLEGVLVKNLTRTGKQPSRGLGEGCKPLTSAWKLTDAPATRAGFEKLKPATQESVRKELSEVNKEWGYYGGPPVPDAQLLDYYYDEEPKGEWVTVEVFVGSGHNIDDLEATGIPFWNRTTGPKSAKFRELCDQGGGGLKRKHEPGVPQVRDE
jgi:hypothetical protein